MDIPLHPAVTAEIVRGREFLDRVGAIRRAQAEREVTIFCPDGDNVITLNGEAMVIGAQFVDEVFDRYPGDELAELLLAMSAEGYAQAKTQQDAAVAGLGEPR